MNQDEGVRVDWTDHSDNGTTPEWGIVAELKLDQVTSLGKVAVYRCQTAAPSDSGGAGERCGFRFNSSCVDTGHIDPSIDQWGQGVTGDHPGQAVRLEWVDVEYGHLVPLGFFNVLDISRVPLGIEAGPTPPYKPRYVSSNFDAGGETDEAKTIFGAVPPHDPFSYTCGGDVCVIVPHADGDADRECDDYVVHFYGRAEVSSVTVGSPWALACCASKKTYSACNSSGTDHVTKERYERYYMSHYV